MPFDLEYELLKFLINLGYFAVGVIFLTATVGFLLRRWGAPFSESIHIIEKDPLALAVLLVGCLASFSFLISVFFT